MRVFYVANAQPIWPGSTVIIQLADSPEEAARCINDRFKRSGIMTYYLIQPEQVEEVTDSVLLNSVMEEGGCRHYNNA